MMDLRPTTLSERGQHRPLLGAEQWTELGRYGTTILWFREILGGHTRCSDDAGRSRPDDRPRPVRR